MNGKDFFEAMSYVDERFVDEAENGKIPKTTGSLWIRWGSLAACLCLMVLAVYGLRPYWDRTATEGILIEDVQEFVNGTPGSIPEVPSVILYVDETTETGFVGIVTELVDTDVLEVGMELNVVMADNTRHETEDRIPSMSADSKADYVGSYVCVQFIAYNRETQTIVVNIIQEVSEKG